MGNGGGFTGGRGGFTGGGGGFMQDRGGFMRGGGGFMRGGGGVVCDQASLLTARRRMQPVGGSVVGSLEDDRRGGPGTGCSWRVVHEIGMHCSTTVVRDLFDLLEEACGN